MTSAPAPEPNSTSASQPEPRPPRLRRLRRAELPLDTVALARELLGTIIVSEVPEGRTAARIVETEAYVPGDAASHAFRGQTPRNQALFLRRGHAYVYFIYGNYYCLNVSAEVAGVGAGVLLRAAEPLAGLPLMRLRRPHSAPRDLCRGPGRLARALAITRLDDGLDLCARGPLWLAARTRPSGEIARSPRIGLTKETARLLRFYERDNPFVSGSKMQNA